MSTFDMISGIEVSRSKMSHSMFMPSWAALLREQYLERSRQQPQPRRTQAYYYEIQRKPVDKSNAKTGHDLASCPYVPVQLEEVEKALGTPSMPSEPLVKAAPVQFLPVYHIHQASGLICAPVPLFPKGVTGVDYRDLIATSSTAQSKVPTPVQDSNLARSLERQSTDELDDSLSSAISEYGFFCEEHEMPPSHRRASHHHHAESPYGQYGPDEYVHLAHIQSHRPRRASGISPRDGHHEHPKRAEYNQLQIPQRYYPHHEGCPCDRCERRKTEQHRQRQVAVRVVHISPPTPEPILRYHCESPRTPPPMRHRLYNPPQSTVHMQRGPSYSRNRTSPPRRREI